MLSKILAVLLAVFMLATGGLLLERSRLNSKLDKAETSITALKAKLDYAAETERLKELEFNQRIGKLKNDLRLKNNKLESERASANTATDSLLKHLEDVKSRIPKADVDTARAAATRTSNVLAECTTRYRDVASEANRLVNKVDSLQTVVRACTQR